MLRGCRRCRPGASAPGGPAVRIQVLLVHDVLDDVVARPFLPVHQLLDQLVPGKQGLHLGEALLQVFGIGQLGFFAHGAAPQKVGHFSTGRSAGLVRKTPIRAINQGTSAPGMRPRMIAVLRPRPGRVAIAVVKARIGHHAGQPRRLLRPELAGADVVIMASRRFGTEDTVAPLDHVQVDLEESAACSTGFPAST